MRLGRWDFWVEPSVTVVVRSFAMDYNRLLICQAQVPFAMDLVCKTLCIYSSLSVNISGYLYKPRYGIIKEELVAFTEIALLAKVILVKRDSVFHTAAATDCQVSADKTFITEIPLGPCKGSLFAAGGQLFYRRFKNITQSPPRLDKKITAESITRMFDNDVLTALFVERANRVLARNVIRQERIEITNAQLSRPVFIPAVKYPAQEFTILPGSD